MNMKEITKLLAPGRYALEMLVTEGKWDKNLPWNENLQILRSSDKITAIHEIDITNFFLEEYPEQLFKLDEAYLPKYADEKEMSKLGFFLTKVNYSYDKKSVHSYEYSNDATVHYNTDYNKRFPEPKGKVIVCISKYSNFPFCSIKNDGNTRTSYNGIIVSLKHLQILLHTIR